MPTEPYTAEVATARLMEWVLAMKKLVRTAALLISHPDIEESPSVNRRFNRVELAVAKCNTFDFNTIHWQSCDEFVAAAEDLSDAFGILGEHIEDLIGGKFFFPPMPTIPTPNLGEDWYERRQE